MGRELEIDPDARIWLRGLRQVDQSTERLLRPQVDREPHCLLVDLGPSQRTRLSAAPRRHHSGARSRGGLRVLERRREQRDDRRRADAQLEFLLRLEYGRAPIPDIPDPKQRLGGLWKLAARPLDRNDPRRLAGACAKPSADPSGIPYPRARTGSRVVCPYQAKIQN